MGDEFRAESLLSTVGVDWDTKVIVVDGVNVTMKIWVCRYSTPLNPMAVFSTFCVRVRQYLTWLAICPFCGGYRTLPVKRDSSTTHLRSESVWRRPFLKR